MYITVRNKFEEFVNEAQLTMPSDTFALLWVKGTLRLPFLEKVADACCLTDYIKENKYTGKDKLGILWTDTGLVPKNPNKCTNDERTAFIEFINSKSMGGVLSDENFEEAYASLVSSFGSEFLQDVSDKGGPLLLEPFRVSYLLLNNTRSILCKHTYQSSEPAYTEDINNYPDYLSLLDKWVLAGLTHDWSESK